MTHPLLIKKAQSPATYVLLAAPVATSLASLSASGYTTWLKLVRGLGSAGYKLGIEPFVEQIPGQEPIDAIIARHVITLDANQLRDLQVELVSRYLQENAERSRKKRGRDVI